MFIRFSREQSRDKMFWQKWILVVFAILFKVESKHYHSIAGPFRIAIRRAEECPPDIGVAGKMGIDVHDARTHRHQDMTFSGTIWYLFALNRTVAGRGRFASWSSMGGWKDNAHFINTNSLCRTLENAFRYFWRRLLINVLGEVLPCDFLPEIYHFHNLTIPLKDLPVKQFFYGRWRVDIMALTQKGEPLGCIRGYGDSVPV